MSNNQVKRAGDWGPKQSQNLDPNRPWASSRRRYEWKDSYDDGIAPKDLELENELFGEENHVHTGINFAKYEEIKVTVDPDGLIKPIITFEEANLHPVMKENVSLAKYEKPTPVQRYSIPIITDGHDLMACAQTGSGKTAAFLIPTLSKLFGKVKKLAAPRPSNSTRRFKAEPLVLIIAPTRELATQIFDECRRFTYRSMMRPCAVYGGAEVVPQKNELAKGCEVLTATPGRLNDFLERGIVSLRRVKYLILDEADRMLDMGFEREIRKIVQKSDLCDEGRQTLMFSATFPSQIRKLAKDFLANNHVFLTVGRVGGTTSDITQKIVYVEDHNKRNQLVELLLKQPPSRTLIFVETKRGADSLDDFLYNQNFPTTSIHGDRTQREREDAIASFRNGRSPILIATAVAARGLDIKNVMHVINYDLCNDIDEYVHRIGRTARVGNQGLATTFYNEKNEDIAVKLVKILMECNQEVPEFLQSYKTQDLKSDDEEDTVTGDRKTTNYKKNSQNDSGYGNWDNGGNQKSWDNNNPAWDGGKVPWDNNNNTARSNNNKQVASWDDRPSWESPPQAQQPSVTSTAQGDWGAHAAPHQPPHQSYNQQSQSPPPHSFQQPQGSPQPMYSKHNTQPSSQYPNQYGGTQPVVKIPRQNNQYSAAQTYNYNTQAPPSYGASDYGGAPNNNPQQSYYQGNSGLNDDNNRNRRRNNESAHIPEPNSDSWGSAPAQAQKEWNPNDVPWSSS